MYAHDYLGSPPKAKGLVGEIDFFWNIYISLFTGKIKNKMYFVLSTFCCGPCEGFVLTFSNSNFTNLRELSGYYRHWFIMFLQNNKADAAAAAYSNLFVKLCLLQPRNDISYPSSMPEWVLPERLEQYSRQQNKSSILCTWE